MDEINEMCIRGNPNDAVGVDGKPVAPTAWPASGEIVTATRGFAYGLIQTPRLSSAHGCVSPTTPFSWFSRLKEAKTQRDAQQAEKKERTGSFI